MTQESLSPICAREGCDRKPTHYPMIFIPAIGYPADRCIKGTVGLAFCRDHAEAFDVAEFLEGDGRAFFNQITAGYGLAKPDFDRARAEARRLDDANWQSFIADGAASQGGGTA